MGNRDLTKAVGERETRVGLEMIYSGVSKSDDMPSN